MLVEYYVTVLVLHDERGCGEGDDRKGVEAETGRGSREGHMRGEK